MIQPTTRAWGWIIRHFDNCVVSSKIGALVELYHTNKVIEKLSDILNITYKDLFSIIDTSMCARARLQHAVH